MPGGPTAPEIEGGAGRHGDRLAEGDRVAVDGRRARAPVRQTSVAAVKRQGRAGRG